LRSWPFKFTRGKPSAVTFFSFEYSVKYIAHPRFGGDELVAFEPDVDAFAIPVVMPLVPVPSVAAFSSEDSKTPLRF
jgi:hypothetical protein